MPAITTKVPTTNPADTVHPNNCLICCSIASPPFALITTIYVQYGINVSNIIIIFFVLFSKFKPLDNKFVA